MKTKKSNWQQLDRCCVRKLLMAQPDFAGKCDLSVLTGADWCALVDAQPLWFASCCDWSKLTGSDWVDLLTRHPQYAERCDWSLLTGKDWVCLLTDISCRPMHWEEKCHWDRLDGDDWACVLHVHPEWAEKCDWNKLELWNWVELLCEFPELADRFESASKRWRPVPSHKAMEFLSETEPTCGGMSL